MLSFLSCWFSDISALENVVTSSFFHLNSNLYDFCCPCFRKSCQLSYLPTKQQSIWFCGVVCFRSFFFIWLNWNGIIANSLWDTVLKNINHLFVSSKKLYIYMDLQCENCMSLLASKSHNFFFDINRTKLSVKPSHLRGWGWRQKNV